MKYIKIFFLLSLFALIFGCEQDYKALNDFSDVNWYTSQFGVKNKPIAIAKYESFADLSIGATSHTWSFSDTSGCKFLTGRITSSDKDYTLFIDPKLDTVSTEKTVSILYTKSGLQAVRLRNTFDSYVEFTGDYGTFKSVKQGNSWVIDTAFVVEVFDTVQVAFNVLHNGEEIFNVPYDRYDALADSASWPVYQIQSGESLTFNDQTTIGKPTTRTWSFGKLRTSTDQAAMLTYGKLGTYYVSILSSRESTVANFPTDTQRKYLPLKIQVIPSDKPFEAISAKLIDHTHLQLSVNGAIASLPATETANFKVHATNTNGFDGDISVASAVVGLTDPTVIDLTLSANVYYSDVITISYTGGNVETVDDRLLTPFSNLSVSANLDNLFNSTFFGFESGGNAATDWIATVTNGTLNYNYATDIVASGNSSLRMDYNGTKVQLFPASAIYNFTLTSGATYLLEFDIYVASATAPNVVNRFELVSSSATGIQVVSSSASLTALGVGKWNHISQTFTNSSLGASPIKFGPKLTTTGIAYFDNFSVKLVDNRP